MNEVLLFAPRIPLAPLIQSLRSFSELIVLPVHSSIDHSSSCFSPVPSKSPLSLRAGVSKPEGSLTELSSQRQNPHNRQCCLLSVSLMSDISGMKMRCVKTAELCSASGFMSKPQAALSITYLLCICQTYYPSTQGTLGRLFAI